MTDRPETDGSGADWREVCSDAAAIANEYRDRDWSAVTVSPRDVAPTRGDDHGGLAVLLADDEFERVAELLAASSADERSVAGRGSDYSSDRPESAEARFDDADVYHRTVGDVGLAIAVERDRERTAVVVVPLYYRREEAADAFEAARGAGELLVHLRPRSSDDWVTFAHDDPSLFVPDDWVDSSP